MNVIFLLFTLWSLYLSLGIGWLSYTVKKKYLEDYNVIASIIIVVMWPIHMFYTKIKK